MISTPCIEVQTTSENRFSVPAWFGSRRHPGSLPGEERATFRLCPSGALGARTYEPIDFLALLIGYAISGERTPSSFFERVEPFETAFMALFGRHGLPHRSSLSRFLADVDRPCARCVPEALRAT
jgi:hypothetical protein